MCVCLRLQISQDDVNNIDSSPVRLQERVQDMRSYPPRVLLHGEDQCGWVRVRTNQMQILEYKWPNQDNRSSEFCFHYNCMSLRMSWGIVHNVLFVSKCFGNLACATSSKLA